MSENKFSVERKNNLTTNNKIKISTIVKLQSLPEEIVLNLLRAKGKLVKDKVGKLRIDQNKS